MNTKFLSATGCLLLLAAAVTPAALGHDERPALAIPYGGDPDGVSGRYVGAAGPALAIEAYSQSHPAYQVISTGSILCDMEVLVDSNASPAGLLNEETVDGFATVGQQPDSFDDGGLGGACHNIYFTTAQFNTPGCQAGQVARASNGATDVFIGAACDWMSGYYGPSDQDLMLCLVNGALAFDPEAPLLDEAGVLVGCVEWYAGCLLSIEPCSPQSPTFSCGADWTLDAIDYGYGSGSFNPAVFPAATGLTLPWWPYTTQPCATTDEVASIFVFDTVATNGGSLVDPDGAGPLEPAYVPGIVSVHPALAGELWTDL